MAAVLAAKNDTQNAAWVNEKGFGFKMMQKMGWCEGKGLGKGEDGMTQHIKLKKKDNNLGIGAEVGQHDRWFSVTNNYDKLLEKLAQSEDSSPKKKPGKKKRKRDDSEDVEKKHKKKKSKKKANGEPVTVEEKAAAEHKRQKKERRAKRKADAEAKRRGTHRRARAKNAGNYSAEAMKEILGVVGAEQD